VLPRDLTHKLTKLLPLLASDQDGEVAGAARAIGRALSAENLDFHDLARVLTVPPAPEPRRPPFKTRGEEPFAEDEPEERRSEVRYRRVLLSGKILLPGGGILDCTLRNRSKRGALVEVPSLIGIPDRFVLKIKATREALDVEVVWRGERELGVQLI
jgi:hypothetical protein